MPEVFVGNKPAVKKEKKSAKNQQEQNRGPDAIGQGTDQFGHELQLGGRKIANYV